MKAKQGQVKTWMDMAKLSQEIGDTAAVSESMGEARRLLAEISEIGDELRKLENGRAEVSAEVDAYLKMGRIGMDIADSTSEKKQKTNAEENQQEKDVDVNGTP